ncbi:hypothetical protein ACF5W4_09730 [Bacillota bacterium Lsc_1132]
MGLDMYLISVPKIEGLTFDETLIAIGRVHEHKAARDEIYEKIKPHIKHGEESDLSWSELHDDIAYWRKANQIHNWFVKHTNNGIDEPVFFSEVTKDKLEILNNYCLEILDKKSNPAKILPTRPGPFFGSLAYDKFYYSEIEETQSIIEDLLNHFDFENRYLYYQCSW